MKLADMQALFQASVLDEAPDPLLLSQFQAPPHAEKIEDAFAVYHDGYRLRLTEFLANDYPVFREAMGEDAFNELADAYIAARPSTFRNARWFGAGLPDFLETTAPYNEESFVRGVAAIEAALAKSFDAEDVAPLPLESLGKIPQEDWPGLRFNFHPAVATVKAPAVALAAYEAVQAGEADPDLSEARAEDLALLVWRDGLDVHYCEVDDLEALALQEALRGKPFGEICGLLAFARPEEPAEELTLAAATFLTQWFAAGMIVAAAP